MSSVSSDSDAVLAERILNRAERLFAAVDDGHRDDTRVLAVGLMNYVRELLASLDRSERG